MSSSSPTRLWRLLACAPLALLATCGKAPPPPAPRLVLLYVTCTLEKHHLEPYDPAVRTTPHLAAFADEGVVFERHVTECGQSGIDFATLFTGKQADGHGIYDHPNVLAERNNLIAETFAAAGYDTYYWSGHPMASSDLGYGQGVPASNVVQRERMFGDNAKPFAKTYLAELSANDARFQGILERLAAEPDYRAFVQVAFTVTHEPYHRYVPVEELLAFLARNPEVAPGLERGEIERWVKVYQEHRHELNWDFRNARAELGLDDADVAALARTLEALYSACVSQLDGYFGQVLDAIRARGLDGQSLVAFTADHGELLWRDNAAFPWTHGLDLAPEILDVPWILRAPGLRPGRYPAVTRSIDVFPTLAGLCGLPIPRSVTGNDLAPALRGQAEAPEALAFSHSPLWPEARIERFGSYPAVHELMPTRDPSWLSVRVRDRDLVCQERRVGPEQEVLEAFDLADDPGQRRNVFDPKDPRHARLVEALRRYKQNLVESFHPEPEIGLTDNETLDRLRALGYIR